MPIIAAHHRPGGWRSTGDNCHTPACDWPSDCLVQWGARGIVIGRKDARGTAFFEAFPTQPSTFIRGEGTSVAEAELAAFQKWQRYLACSGHVFERRNYRNGAGFCCACNLFNSSAFEPLERCVICEAATYFSYGTDNEGVQHWYCEVHASLRDKTVHPSPTDALDEDNED